MKWVETKIKSLDLFRCLFLAGKQNFIAFYNKIIEISKWENYNIQMLIFKCWYSNYNIQILIFKC